MPFIYNNKDYRFVESNVQWDQLEYVVVRKLRVDFVEKKIDIQTIRDKMETYGPLERIEVFRNQSDQIFAHVTFKLDVCAFFALKEVESAANKVFIEKIHPADARIQPDNPIDPSTSPMENLTDNSLETIFRFCNIHEQARLGMVCKRFREVLTNRVWLNCKVFKIELGNEIEFEIQTAVHLIQCKNPKTFKISMVKAIDNKFFDLVVEFDSAKTSILITSDCLVWIMHLYELSDKIQTLSIKLSAHKVFDTFCSPIFNSVKEFRVIGIASYMPFPEIEKFCEYFPNIRKMYFENGRFCHRNFIDYMKIWKTLDHFYFKECTFTELFQLKNISDFCKDPERLVWIYVDLIREPIPFNYCACCGEDQPDHSFKLYGEFCIFCGEYFCKGICFLPQNDSPEQHDFVRAISGPLPDEITNEKMN